LIEDEEDTPKPEKHKETATGKDTEKSEETQKHNAND